jgi:hypothetical protein
VTMLGLIRKPITKIFHLLRKLFGNSAFDLRIYTRPNQIIIIIIVY